MKAKKIIVVVLSILLVLITGWLVVQSIKNPSQGKPTAPPPPDAPDFTVTDINGTPVKLSDLKGKPVVLNFWASWCGPCRMEMPEFEKVYLEMKDKVTFLMVNVTISENSKQDAVSLIQQLGHTFPVYYDADGTATAAYGVDALPTTCFIDSKGRLITRAAGAMDADTLKHAISQITD